MVDSIGDENVAVEGSWLRNGAEELNSRHGQNCAVMITYSPGSEIWPENAIPGSKRMHDMSRTIQLQSAKMMPRPQHEVLKSLLQMS
jgi:hypothetical protein